MQKQKGQALVSGLFFIVITLLFSTYFLFVSESYFHLFSNQEQANADVARKASLVANTLNEIAINNENIIAALTVSQDALLRSLERSLQVAFSQPYWLSGNPLFDAKGMAKTLAQNYKNKNNLFDNISFGKIKLTSKNKNLIKVLFEARSQTSARGFILAGALAKKNGELVRSLPLEMSLLFTQSSNAEVNCFALNTEKKYYQKPGILKTISPEVSNLNFYEFYMKLDRQNHCAFAHDASLTHKSTQILDYEKIDELSQGKKPSYGIYYVKAKYRTQFMWALNFYSNNKVKETDTKFIALRRVLSKTPYFQDLGFENEESMVNSPYINHFKIVHPHLFCKSENGETGTISEDNFLKAFFKPNWSVTGIYL